MALTLPTAEDFYLFWGDEADEEDEDRADMLIQLSADLFWLATGIETDPEDSRLTRLIHFAICDMAIYLAVSRDNVNEAYSPYQSERIGSYSYSKTYMALSKTLASNAAEGTGVFFFDKVVQYLVDNALYAGGLMTSENVFHRGYEPLMFASGGLLRVIREADPNVDRRALYGYFGNADDDEGRYSA